MVNSSHNPYKAEHQAEATRGSVGRGAGIVIERLQKPGSTSDVIVRCCVLGKDA